MPRLGFSKIAGRGRGPALSYKRLTVRVPTDIYDKLKAHADDNGVAINFDICYMIRRALEDVQD